MNLFYHKNFERNFKKRIIPFPPLVEKFQTRLTLFLEDPKNPELKSHKLIGKMKNLKSFSVSGDIRVVYFEEGNNIVLLDIGSHNQVY